MDTNSTLAGALAAAKLHIPVAHVEAGLRSFNRRMPEEQNRVLTDHLADLLFAPTDAAVANLAREGIDPCSIVRTGDVMYDVALHFAAMAEAKSRILADLRLDSKSFVLATVHWAENTDDPDRLETIFTALIRLAESCRVVLPLHPRTRAALALRELLELVESRLTVIAPVGYLDMVALEKHARLVVTDSGGGQKEAFFHAIPCVTLREETEWIELLETGWNSLAPPTGGETLLDALLAGLHSPGGEKVEIYGDGNSAGTIVDELTRLLAR